MVATAPDAPCLEPLHWPVRLAQQLRLSPEQFELVCEANPDTVLELSADGHLITITPTGSETSARNSTLAGCPTQLRDPLQQNGSHLIGWAGSRESLGFLHQTNPSWIPTPGSTVS